MLSFTAPVNCQECEGEREKFYYWANRSARLCKCTMENCSCIRGTLKLRAPEGYEEIDKKEYDCLKEEWRKLPKAPLSQVA